MKKSTKNLILSIFWTILGLCFVALFALFVSERKDVLMSISSILSAIACGLMNAHHFDKMHHEWLKENGKE